MAIVKMSKFNLFSFDDQRDALLKKLQEFNYVHFNKVEGVDEKSEGVREVDLSLIHISEPTRRPG